ncbi:MAG: hypothetical protein QXM25_03225 [Nitrososphaerales archaeon]
MLAHECSKKIIKLVSTHPTDRKEPSILEEGQEVIAELQTPSCNLVQILIDAMLSSQSGSR